jgi:hypothetical protein
VINKIITITIAGLILLCVFVACVEIWRATM